MRARSGRGLCWGGAHLQALSSLATSALGTTQQRQCECVCVGAGGDAPLFGPWALTAKTPV